MCAASTIMVTITTTTTTMDPGQAPNSPLLQPLRRLSQLSARQVSGFELRRVRIEQQLLTADPTPASTTTTTTNVVVAAAVAAPQSSVHL